MHQSTPRRRLAVLGSTGSIGTQTLDIVRMMPQHFQIIALAAGSNVAALNRQINEFQPSYIYCPDRTALAFQQAKVIPLEEIATLPEVDIVVNAISGAAGLLPLLASIRAGKSIALANKEALVIAGEILTREAQRYGAEILPVDSEHSAIWQCLRGEPRAVANLILTASGGPFRNYTVNELTQVTPEQALQHPSWKMGPKITINSATLMNKGLEVIEAHWLFDIPIENVKILIHPQSIVHSMVEFTDGSTKAQLSYPDMRLPIMYALSYPERLANPALPRLEWGKIDKLTFTAPDDRCFPCLKLAISAGKNGGTYPAVLYGADEAAVTAFLARRIRFTDIAALVQTALDTHRNYPQPGLADITAADNWARQKVKETLGTRIC